MHPSEVRQLRTSVKERKVTGRVLVVANRLPVTLTNTSQIVAKAEADVYKFINDRSIDRLPSAHTASSLLHMTSPPLDMHKHINDLIHQKKPPLIVGPKEWRFKMSSGGLVSALQGLQGIEMKWVGWPGVAISNDNDKKIVQDKLKNDYNCVPVFLSERTAEQYYGGFSNAILWPLMHYAPAPVKVLQQADTQWEAYKQANDEFAKIVIEHYKPGDLVWVHDYHLFLLPSLLRDKIPDMKIGFFLHTPFPSSELLRVLPWRSELLNGILASNLIGFQTHDYCSHFRSACTEILGKVSRKEGVQLSLDQPDFVSVKACPIGINPEKFIKAFHTDEVRKKQKRFSEMFAGKKVLLGVDRLDYTKGLPHKLYAMERFLENNESYIGQIVFVQIAVPTRSDVPEYRALASEVHQIVSRINGRFGTVTDAPIHFLDKFVDFDDLCALYRTADVCLCTPTRDGMNLVAFEYAICQDETDAGVLILSEFAGAAQSLGAGALRVNPWHIDEVAGAILHALTMDKESRNETHGYIRKHILTHSAQLWAEDYLRTLSTHGKLTGNSNTGNGLNLFEVKKEFKNAKLRYKDNKGGHRVVVVGLVGTLTTGDSRSYTSDSSKIVDEKVLTALEEISQDDNTTVVVITSRSRKTCEYVLKDSTAWVCAENGYFVKKNSVWTCFYPDVQLDWIDTVVSILQYFTDRTPRSFIFQTETHISWYYNDCDPTFGAKQAKDLLLHLLSGPLASTPTEVFNTGQRVQIRHTSISKAFTIRRIISDIEHMHGQHSVQFALCVGQFIQMDQNLFKSIERWGRTQHAEHTPVVYTCSLGARSSSASYQLDGVYDVICSIRDVIRCENKEKNNGEEEGKEDDVV